MKRIELVYSGVSKEASVAEAYQAGGKVIRDMVLEVGPCYHTKEFEFLF